MQPISKKNLDASEMVNSIIGCKWSVGVLDAITEGVHRPSDLQRACEGISTKVLNERLRKLIRFELIERISYPVSPPRVEYKLTELGSRFLPVLEAVRTLQREIEAAGDTNR